MPYSKLVVSPSIRSARGAEKRVRTGWPFSSTVCCTRRASMKPLLKSSVSSILSPVSTAPSAWVRRTLPWAKTRLALRS